MDVGNRARRCRSQSRGRRRFPARRPRIERGGWPRPRPDDVHERRRMDELAIERKDMLNWRAKPGGRRDDSNTGCTSVCDRLITLRISLVAVCRSSASWVSLNRRTFSIAIPACAAKVWSSAICSPGNGPGSGRPTVMAPIGLPSRTRGTASMLRKPPRLRKHLPQNQGPKHIRDCDSAPCQDCPGCRHVAARWPRLEAADRLGPFRGRVHRAAKWISSPSNLKKFAELARQSFIAAPQWCRIPAARPPATG